MKKSILVTGGTGFIGSHTCVVLLDAGYDVIVLDNLCNSEAAVIARIGQICGQEPVFIKGDIRDAELLGSLFAEHSISAVLHFAGLKAVGESVNKPQEYYDNNVVGTSVLLSAMQNSDVKTIVFSSSATVYGEPASVPITEDFPRSATNPYGENKLEIEDMLADLYQSSPGWRIARLRYFNPIGAHESGLIGESPSGIPDNLMPFITQAAAGLRDELSIFGDDYDTPDGTGVRDYIHVVDLANGHVAALDYLEHKQELLTVNLGTGHGVSVLEMIKTFETVNHCKVPYRITARRSGDIAKCWADTNLANRLLGWQATLTLEDMCLDAWRWQTKDLKQLAAQLPKAELHIHIEGSLEPAMMFELAGRNGVELPYPDVESITNAYNFNCLQDFLDLYYQGMSVLLTEQDFHDLTWAYLQRCYRQNVVHCEIFFDPQGHTERGIGFEVFMGGICSALDKAQAELGISSRLIMCFLRHLDEQSAFATLEAATPYLGRITGVGLDSSEMGHPPNLFSNVFARAGELGLKRVAHAGEEGPPEYVYEALNLLNVDRIDHGNRSLEDEALVQRLVDERMSLTVCPQSNLRLAVIKDMSDHPIRRMLALGLNACVNSDDPAYFGGYMNENFDALIDATGLTRDEIFQLTINGFESSFLTRAEKQPHLDRINAMR